MNRGARRRSRRRYLIKVTVHPYVPGVVNAFGDPVSGWGMDRELPKCSFAVTGTGAEIGPGRRPVTTKGDLYVFDGAPPGSRDEVTVPGHGRFQIEGKPEPWGPNPFTGSQPGIVVSLTRTEG